MQICSYLLWMSALSIRSLNILKNSSFFHLNFVRKIKLDNEQNFLSVENDKESRTNLFQWCFLIIQIEIVYQGKIFSFKNKGVDFDSLWLNTKVWFIWIINLHNEWQLNRTFRICWFQEFSNNNLVIYSLG